MREFKDDEGRPWILALTCAAAERLKDLVTADIEEEVTAEDGTVTKSTKTVPFDIGDVALVAPLMSVLHRDMIKRGEVVYAILRHQVEQKGLTREQFLDGMRGESLDAAADALESEVIAFFPPSRRDLVSDTVRTVREMFVELSATARRQVQAMSETGLSGISSGRRQASSASTQANGPTDSSQLLETHA